MSWYIFHHERCCIHVFLFICQYPCICVFVLYIIIVNSNIMCDIVVVQIYVFQFDSLFDDNLVLGILILLVVCKHNLSILYCIFVFFVLYIWFWSLFLFFPFLKKTRCGVKFHKENVVGLLCSHCAKVPQCNSRRPNWFNRPLYWWHHGLFTRLLKRYNWVLHFR